MNHHQNYDTINYADHESCCNSTSSDPDSSFVEKQEQEQHALAQQQHEEGEQQQQQHGLDDPPIKDESCLKLNYNNVPTTASTSTCDIYDEYLEKCRVIGFSSSNNHPSCCWNLYGGHHQFWGKVVTIQCYNDNSYVKRLLEGNLNEIIVPSTSSTTTTTTDHNCDEYIPRVLVIDGGGSTYCALLGDLIATAAVNQCYPQHKQQQQGVVVTTGGGGLYNTRTNNIRLSPLPPVWSGIIVYGCVRDSYILKQLPIGIVAIGTTPRKSIRKNVGQYNVPIQLPSSTNTSNTPNTSTTSTISNNKPENDDSTTTSTAGTTHPKNFHQESITIQPGDYVFVDSDGMIFLSDDEYIIR